MKIGIQFSQPAVDPDPQVYLRSYVSLVETAHQAGFHSFWAGQHFIPSDGYALFQPFPLIARLAAAAPGMWMGTSVQLIPMQTPLDVAESVAALDVMTGGRFILGAGLGYREVELAGNGIRRAHLVGRFEETVEICKRLWSGDTSGFQGKHFQLAEGVGISPRPVQRPRPQILVGGEADAAVERAGRITDGWVITPRMSEPTLSEKLAIFRASAKRHGSAGILGLMRPFHVTEDRAEAERTLEIALAHFGQKRAWGSEKSLLKPGDDPDAVPPLDAVIGDPDACVEAIRRYRERYQPDHMILLMGFKGMPESQLRRAIELAGEKVLPRIS